MTDLMTRRASAVSAATDRFLLNDEDPLAFAQMAQRLQSFLAPVGPLEEHLCQHLCRTIWRQDRGQRFERELLDGLRKSRPEPDGTSPTLSAITRDGHGPRVFPTIIRYQAHTATEFHRTLHMLSVLQERRLGEDAPTALLLR